MEVENVVAITGDFPQSAIGIVILIVGLLDVVFRADERVDLLDVKFRSSVRNPVCVVLTGIRPVIAFSERDDACC